MKKLLMIMVMGLLFSSTAHAVTMSCYNNEKKDYYSPSDCYDFDCKEVIYHAIDIILDPNGLVHVTEYSKWVPWNEVWGAKFREEQKKIESRKDRKKRRDKRYYNYNPLLKEKKKGEEIFTEMAFKAGHKIRTRQEPKTDQTMKFLVYMNYYEIDLKEKTVKRFFGVTDKSREIWNSDAEKAGVPKVKEPKLDLYFINCKSSDASGSTGDAASSGSGFFINNKGYFVTNYHVVAECNDESKISFKEEEVDAKLIAKDESLDLALLKAKVKPKSYLYLSADPPEKIQTIYVAGYPFGKGLSDDLKITQGIISSLKGFGDNSNEIQIDAAINPGNSGGPIVNDDGELMAVAVSGLAKDQSEGINFGIKASSVKNFLDVNKAKYSTSSLMKFSMSNKELNDILEESTVYTFCN
jgi:S1-C subfamily serine protease